MMYTEDVYANMIVECRKIATDFIKGVSDRRAVLDLANNIDDLDEWELAQEEIAELFDKFKSVMGLESSLRFFRDNDEEYGQYCEDSDAVILPMCIGCYNERDIVEHMTHELYHAFQYSAICEPDKYPCFDAETIKMWDYEFHNYVSGAKDMKQYLGQEIEKTARAFGTMISNK